MNGLKLLIAPLILSILLMGCSENPSRRNEKSIYFNFADTVRLDSMNQSYGNEQKVLRFAISAISSPRETFDYYHQMFRYIEEQLGQRVIMIQRKTYQEVNDLMKENKADIAIVCSGNYVYGIADSAFKLLVVPEWKGKSYYNTYIIAHKNSGIESFEDLKGKRFAFTDPLSASGKLYPSKKVRDRELSPVDFFEGTVYTYAHDNSIQLVAKQMVDGASVNSLVFDYLAASSPGRVKDIIIIETSPPQAMPPVVVSYQLPADLENRLIEIFLNMHNDTGSKLVLEKLMVDRYVKQNDSIYNSVRVLAGVNAK
ncbi:substrate-binding domain-containing protein [Perlabentimonas gracilis]|uniref:substrate-binding domain-containing protein n=1 Tax=Perlabentimonas gracilis TaxID=2715279 RepID=UPI00140BC651|nr:phosphate/phosphite/phosphonate ABC transporter substrate-binding protein [Perlabentimonas gracilis]NHB70138.1 phosphate/phosphite/phosphonate ABC transporter substrate-binding protein [Perlabentimonas gracilis]